MTFKTYNNIVLAEGVSEQSFLQAINSYSSIEDAMVNLKDEFIEWYLLNLNSKSLKHKLKKLHIDGISEAEIERTLGFAPAADKVVKNIKYKGQFITIEYDRDLGSWFPAIRFRSIISAMKYIKGQVDYDEKNI